MDGDSRTAKRGSSHLSLAGRNWPNKIKYYKLIFLCLVLVEYWEGNFATGNIFVKTNFYTYHLETPLGALSEVLMRYHVHLSHKPWNPGEILLLEPIFFHLATKTIKCRNLSTNYFSRAFSDYIEL